MIKTLYKATGNNGINKKELELFGDSLLEVNADLLFAFPNYLWTVTEVKDIQKEFNIPGTILSLTTNNLR